MIELGKKGEIFGTELFRQLAIQHRPVEVPPLGKDEKIVCGFDQGLGERMLVCESVEEMQTLWDKAHKQGLAIRCNWYAGPDPGFIAVAS